MVLYKAEGIILKARAYGEADSIITLLTKEQGKINVIAKGVRKIKSRKRGSVQPFTYSRFLIYGGKSLDIITQGDIVESFSYLGEDLDFFTLGSYCCELVDNFLPEKEENREVFSLLLNTFYYLPFTDKDIIIRAFELRLLNLMGYLPMLRCCVNCQQEVTTRVFFSSLHGGLLCENCRGKDIYSILATKGVFAIMEQLIKLDYKKLKVLKLKSEDKILIQKIMENYIRYLLEKRLKTIDIIKSLNIKEP